MKFRKLWELINSKLFVSPPLEFDFERIDLVGVPITESMVSTGENIYIVPFDRNIKGLYVAKFDEVLTREMRLHIEEVLTRNIEPFVPGFKVIILEEGSSPVSLPSDEFLRSMGYEKADQK